MATKDRRGVSVDATDTAIAGSPNPGLAIKAPCRVATTANIVLSGLQTIDGVALAAGNRVLVKSQTDPTTNGLYNASTGPWTRTVDFTNNGDVADGMQVFVAQGATQGNASYTLLTPDPITLGTTALTFSIISVGALRNINTTLPLAGGGNLTADRTLSIVANGVTYSFLQQVAAASLVGNPTGALANAQGITVGATLAFSGSNLQTVALTGDVASGANSFVTTIQPNAVSYAKMQQASASRLLGNPTGAGANLSEISLGATLAFSGSALQTAAGTGDVAWSANSFATTVQPNAITGAKFRQSVGLSVVGNSGTATGNVVDITGTANLVLVVNAAGTSLTFGQVTYAGIQNVSASRLLGNPTGAAASAAEIALGATLTFSGSSVQTVALTGDVTTAANSFATTIAAGTVSNSKMANMAAWTFKGNATAGSAAPTDFTIDSLTLKASPTSSDEVAIWDAAASGMKKAAFPVAGAVNPSQIQNYLSGLTLSNDGTSPNTVLDIAAGVATDSTNAVLMQIAAFTKSTGGAWASGSGGNGMGNGLTIAASTWYHVLLANNGGTPDIWFDTSLTGANRPAGITDARYRRIGSFRTNGSSQITAFTQRGQEFMWAAPLRDVFVTPIASTSSNTSALTVPTGVVVQGIISVTITGSGATNVVYVRALSETDLASSFANGTVTARDPTTTGGGGTTMTRVWTNTSAQFAWRAAVSGGSTEMDVMTFGWFDTLGK